MNANQFAQTMADHFNDSSNPYKKEWVNKAATIITERDKRIRAEALREAADRAVVFAIDEGWICSPKTADRFRAAILAGEVKE